MNCQRKICFKLLNCCLTGKPSVTQLRCLTNIHIAPNNFPTKGLKQDNLGFSKYIVFCEQKRLKFTKKSKQADDSDSDDSSDEEDETDAQSKLIRGHVQSLRADTILKAGLGMARNKIETLFYESRIRVNGRKIFKKSQRLNIDDEVDVIKGVSQLNDDFLKISRVQVLKAKGNEEGDGIVVKMRRYKSLDVENYPDEHRWKE